MPEIGPSGLGGGRRREPFSIHIPHRSRRQGGESDGDAPGLGAGQACCSRVAPVLLRYCSGVGPLGSPWVALGFQRGFREHHHVSTEIKFTRV
jgi:hypothetical protein